MATVLGGEARYLGGREGRQGIRFSQWVGRPAACFLPGVSRKPVRDQAEASAGTVGTHSSQEDGGGRMGPRTRNKGRTCRVPKGMRSCQGDNQGNEGA